MVATTPFISIAGTQLSLPATCHPEYSFTFLYQLAAAAPQTPYKQMVGGNYVECPLSVQFELVTDGTASDRTVIFEVNDENGNPLSRAVAAAVQPASTTVSYTANVGLSTAYGPIGSTASFGLPTFAVLPGWTMEITWTGGEAGDQIKAIALTVIRVPTGLLDPDTTAVAATPVLV